MGARMEGDGKRPGYSSLASLEQETIGVSGTILKTLMLRKSYWSYSIVGKCQNHLEWRTR